jgi:acetyl-CoA acyltransferase
MSSLSDRDVVIVEAVRTPIGRFRGALSNVRADHLGALVLNELVKRAGIEAAAVNDVIFGCVTLGLQTICCAGGMATATVLERLN